MRMTHILDTIQGPGLLSDSIHTTISQYDAHDVITQNVLIRVNSSKLFENSDLLEKLMWDVDMNSRTISLRVERVGESDLVQSWDMRNIIYMRIFSW